MLPVYTKYGCRPDKTHLEEEEKASCFAIVVLQMYCYFKRSVELPRGAVCWSAVSDCGISCSYQLTFRQLVLLRQYGQLMLGFANM